jgi:predicted dehydrogenase
MMMRFDDLYRALIQTNVAVLIYNSSSGHFLMSLAAATKSRTLFIEKSALSQSVDGIEELIDVVQRKNVVVLLGNQICLHPCLKYLHTVLSENGIDRGRVVPATE